MKKIMPKVIVAVLLATVSACLLKGDVWTFWTWWILAGILGFVGMPLSGRLFAGFEDKGWIFSKVLSIALTGFTVWFLVSLKILKFNMGTCIVVCVLYAVGSLFLFYRQMGQGTECFPVGKESLIFWEEVLFFVMFLIWTYFAGFHPAAYGTEKFMDYGFMEAMMRSTELPAIDLWYSQGHINYYYGGQYFAVFLTKLSGSKVEITYNLMRAFVAGLAFVMPFSLVYQLITDRMQGKVLWKRNPLPAIAGITAGAAVSLAGNMHYVIYGLVLPVIEKWKGLETESGYWFPNATRYIGFDPDVPDKTIHEFPSYSFVLGDLHAHVVNIMFVLLLVAILYAWMKQVRSREEFTADLKQGRFWKEQLFMPHLLLVSLFLGMFQWTNFWDFVIYFVVTGGVVLFSNIILFKGKLRVILAVTAAQAVEVLLISYVAILPFTLQFQTMVQGVALAQNHSLPHQLLVLWGLPVILTVLFIFSVLLEKCKGIRQKKLFHVMESIAVPDLFVIILGLCAMGLVLIPELVYVRDIYENGNARANTMFKLTYQAYMMFGMVMGYSIYRLLIISRNICLKILSCVGLFFLILTMGYLGNCAEAWFGNVWNPKEYKGLNAVKFLEIDFWEDAAAIRWLKENIEGSPVVLEANGDSYTNYQRVSAMTGLPTILGWYVHEWLWRSNPGDLNQKSSDVEMIYTSTEEELVKQLLDTYQVSYIFIGSTEREKYGERLNEALLGELGNIVFKDQNSQTYIIKIDR